MLTTINILLPIHCDVGPGIRCTQRVTSHVQIEMVTESHESHATDFAHGQTKQSAKKQHLTGDRSQVSYPKVQLNKLGISGRGLQVGTEYYRESTSLTEYHKESRAPKSALSGG
jgi:hypothetical protein